MQIIGHRGCPDHFPENTVAAVRGATPHVDMVEIDVRRCNSGELVVFHDETLDRLTDESGPIRERTYEELSTISVDGSAETIPTLADVLDELPDGTGINVELKEPGMSEDVAPLVRELDREVIVSSFETEALAAFRDEPVATAYLFEGAFAKNMQRAASLGCEFLHPYYEITDGDSVSQAHERNFAVNAWTVPTRADVARLEESGVDGVIVDTWEIVPR